MVNVWAAEARVVLAQCKAPGRNEAFGALEALDLLDLNGCIVTADALHCHRAFARKVLKRGGNYVLALKENQSKLFADAARLFGRAGKRTIAEQLEPSTHDRREWRRATVIRDTSFAATHDFPGIVAVAPLTSRRRPQGGRSEPLVRYFLLSKYMPAKRLLRVVATHWSIENQLHWVLDVVFDEDRQSSQKGQCPREPRDPARARSQCPSHPTQPQSHAPKNKTSRVGRCLPARLCSVICDSPALSGEGLRT